MGIFDAALLAAIITISVPILLAATGELISERTGVLNVGLEGMMLVGAFGAFVGTWVTQSPWTGLLIGALSGTALAGVMAVVAIGARANQIVAGIGVNLLALGLTSFLFAQLFSGQSGQLVPTVGRVDIPGLSDLGGVAGVLLTASPVTYLAVGIVIVVMVLLRFTRWGLSIHAVGEHPFAADTAGINVPRVRVLGTLTAGALAGLGGAYLIVVEFGIFQDDISRGRGFLALAVVLLSRWRPGGVVLASLLFGAMTAIQFRLQALGTIPPEMWVLISLIALGIAAFSMVRAIRRPTATRMIGRVIGAGVVATAGIVLAATGPKVQVPSEFWLALPFIVALIILALIGSARMPAGLVVPYIRGDR